MKRTPQEHVKPTFSDIPAEALWELGKTYTLGTKKHGLGNWREPQSWLDVYDGMLRHMLRWRMGGDASGDDGHYHMGAIAHRALWLLVYHLDPTQYGMWDDRLWERTHRRRKKIPRGTLASRHNSASCRYEEQTKRRKGENHGSKENKRRSGTK